MTEDIRKNYEINTDEVRNAIFDFLDSHGKTKYPVEEILSIETVNKIMSDCEAVSLRQDGARIWIVAMIINERYYCVSFPVHNPDRRAEVLLHPITCELKASLYDGTIMQGTYRKEKGVKYFQLDELFVFSGEDQREVNKHIRVDYLREIIVNGIVNTAFTEITSAIFYKPDKAGINTMYLYLCNEIANHQPEGVHFWPNRIDDGYFYYLIQGKDLSQDVQQAAVLILEKTSTPDVIKLYLPESGAKSISKNKKANEFVGNALITGRKESTKIASWFGRKKRVIAKCVQDGDTDGWIPVELVES